VRLPHADLRLADLRGADLSGANLQGANLIGAQLQGAELCGAKLAEARLTLRVLEGAHLCPDTELPADLDAHNLTAEGVTNAPP